MKTNFFTLTECESTIPGDRKRHDEQDPLPLERMKKRQQNKTPLSLDTYESLCLDMMDLSYEREGKPDNSDTYNLLGAFENLEVETLTKEWSDLSIPQMLDLEWSAVLRQDDRAQTKLERACRLCRYCGIRTFRDILWYNNTLGQPASLQRFPVCLVDMAFSLVGWAPRADASKVNSEDWRNAWLALADAWPKIVVALPPALKQSLLIRKSHIPPESANWFEFSYLDGMFSEKQALLCYHDIHEDGKSVGQKSCIDLIEDAEADPYVAFTAALNAYFDDL